MVGMLETRMGNATFEHDYKSSFNLFNQGRDPTWDLFLPWSWPDSNFEVKQGSCCSEAWRDSTEEQQHYPMTQQFVDLQSLGCCPPMPRWAAESAYGDLLQLATLNQELVDRTSCQFCPAEGRQLRHFTGMGDLPLQVFEKLLMLLPIQAIFEARKVCKGWKSIISSPSFLPMWLKHFNDHCFLMGYPEGRQVMAVSDVNLKRRWNCTVPPPPPFQSQDMTIHPVASDGGLVVYFCDDPVNMITTLCVYNPFTVSYHMLPPVELLGFGAGKVEVLISTDSSGDGYLVFIVAMTSRPNKKKARIEVSIYDSNSRFWLKRGITPDDDSNAPGNWSVLHSNGVLYILSHVDGVISYDFTRDIWGRVGTPLSEIYSNGYLVHEKLLLHDRHLLLMGTTLERDEFTDELVHRLYVYELLTKPGYDNSPYVYWELFDKLPDELMQIVNPHSREGSSHVPPEEFMQDIDFDPHVYAEHNALPVSCYQCEDVVLMFFPDNNTAHYVEGASLVAYRLSTKVWTRVIGWDSFFLKQQWLDGKTEGELQLEQDKPLLLFTVVGFKPSLAFTG